MSFLFIQCIKSEHLSAFYAHIESLADRKTKSEKSVFILYTPGCVAESVEKIVDIIRHVFIRKFGLLCQMGLYQLEQFFVCQAIKYMDYFSMHNPIDT